MFTAGTPQKASELSQSLNFDKLSKDFSASELPTIRNYLINTCACDEMVYSRDLYEMEKELETLTRDTLFFESILKNLKQKLEVHLRKCQDRAKVKTRKMPVNDVLAWNNELYCMRMLKHSFLHRRSEYMVNFKVSDLLAGNRAVFENAGKLVSVALYRVFQN